MFKSIVHVFQYLSLLYNIVFIYIYEYIYICVCKFDLHTHIHTHTHTPYIIYSYKIYILLYISRLKFII